MKEGDILLAPFPQADGHTKNRPAVLLRIMRPFGDFLVCGISRQLRHEVALFDELIGHGDVDFEESRLLGRSLIRVGFLTVLPPSDFLGEIGSISPERHLRLLRRLAAYLELPAR
jgi:mRNA interferase MazF